MSEILSRFDFRGAEFTPVMYLAAAIIWLMVLGCAVASILSRPISWKARIAWSLVVIGLPGVGLLVYLPFSCRKEEYAAVVAVISGCIPKMGK